MTAKLRRRLKERELSRAVCSLLTDEVLYADIWERPELSNEQNLQHPPIQIRKQMSIDV